MTGNRSIKNLPADIHHYIVEQFLPGKSIAATMAGEFGKVLSLNVKQLMLK